jgi:Tol biopolymer transport system component
VLAWVFSLAWPWAAFGQLECQLEQLTDEVTSDFGGGHFSQGSSKLVLSGQGDVSTGSSFDLFLADVGGGGLENLTDADGYDGNGSISADGVRIAFESEVDHVGTNADGNREIMLFDRATGEIEQLTFSSGSGNARPVISGDGTRVIFRSAEEYVDPIPHGSEQIYMIDTTDGSIVQLTQLEGIPRGFTTDLEMNWLAYGADQDLIGQNPDENYEVFVLAIETGVLSQITNTTTGGNHSPSVYAWPRRMAFFSESEEYIGPNPEGLPELVVYESCNGRFTQLSDENPNSYGLIISADGDRVGLSLNQQLALYELSTGEVLSVAGPGGITGFVSSTKNGTIWSIRSNQDLVGENPDGSFEIFVARCGSYPLFADGFECGDTSAWSSSTGVP